jgi:hypothetical protein
MFAKHKPSNYETAQLIAVCWFTDSELRWLHQDSKLGHLGEVMTKHWQFVRYFSANKGYHASRM